MQEAKLSGEKKFGNKQIKLDVPVIFFEEDGIYYAYMPSMDLTGYGKTADEARVSLTIVHDEFLRYTLKKNTFFLELQRLGWKIKRSKKPMTAPNISDLININQQLRDIVNSKSYSTSNLQVQMPAFA